MKREIKIELGGCINLYERLSNEDAPRSIALAIRTFQRSKINREKILIMVDQRIPGNDLEKTILSIEKLQKSAIFNKKEFLREMGLLIKLIT